MLRLSLALFLVQAGFHGFTASLPLALARAGRADAEIGLIVGVAALVQVVAALVAGALIDRLGGLRLFIIGGLAYIGAALILLAPGVEPAGATLPFIVARILQGVGFGFALPAGLSVVPRLVPASRQGVALAVAGASHNLSLVVLPPLSIAVLDIYGLDGVSVLVAGLVTAALVTTAARRLELRAGEVGLAPVKRHFGMAYRSTWAAPLAITVLFAAHWGVVVAYLPQRADLAGANIGLFFAADGIGVLLARLPAGWLADRVAPLRPMLVGIGMTIIGVVLLLPPPTTEVLVVGGALTGAGAALIVTPLMLALTQRSDDADRGSAFALFSASFAAAIAIGSLGAVPLIEAFGFELTMGVMLVALGVSALVAVADRGFGSRPASLRARDVEVAVGPPVEQ
jgi:MFS family permease